MNIKFDSLVLIVKDIEVAKQFYTEVLNQEVRIDFGKCIGFKNKFSIWELRDEHVISQKLGAKTVADANRTELCFETEDIHTDYEQLKANKVEFLHKMHEEPWGQLTIRFFDPDGHLIEIGESIQAFVTKFLNQGLDEQQVAERTFVPIDEVKKIAGSL